MTGGGATGSLNSPYYRDPSRPKDDHNIHYVCNGMRFTSNINNVLIDNEDETDAPIQLFRLVRTDPVLFLTCYADDLGKRALRICQHQRDN